MTDKSWENSIQELIDLVAKPNWKEADKHGEIVGRLYNACFEVWLAARRQATKSITITSIMYMTIFKELHWAFISVMSGAHLTAVRTFRFVFEYAVQSSILEEKYRDLPDSDDKIDIALEDPESKHFNWNMIDRLKFLDDAEIASSKELYHRLSEFVHPQSKMLKTVTPGSLVSFDLDPGLLELCARLAVDVSDVLAVVLLHEYTALKHESELKEIVEELGLKMTRIRIER
jgi:hypothetical protein